VWSVGFLMALTNAKLGFVLVNVPGECCCDDEGVEEEDVVELLAIAGALA